MERGHTRCTQETCQTNLRHFMRWADGAAPAVTVQDVTPSLLKRYVYSMSDGGLKPRSVTSRINAIRTFSTYLFGEGHLKDDPCKSMRTPNLDAPKQDMVEDDDARALLSACDRIAGARKSAQAGQTGENGR